MIPEWFEHSTIILIRLRSTVELRNLVKYLIIKDRFKSIQGRTENSKFEASGFDIKLCSLMGRLDVQVSNSREKYHTLSMKIFS